MFTDVRAFHVDSIANVYLVGRFAGTLDVDPGAGTVDLTSMGPETDIVIVKLDPAGTLVWARQLGGAGSEAVNDAVVDDLGQVFVTGFSDSLGFVTMLDNTGAPIWQRTFGDSSGTFNDTAGRAPALTGLGGVVVVGHFSGVLHLDLPSSPLDRTTATGTGFLFDFDGAGNFGWTRQLGGRGDDVSSTSSAA